MTIKNVPFTVVCINDKAKSYLDDCIERAVFENGHYNELATTYLSRLTDCSNVLLTPSCTAALEMSALLVCVGPGDEVIMPSYTFVSTANAFVLRGATPVFVDICPMTLNIDPIKIRAAITDKTRAIVAVHYAGVACDMDSISRIAQDHNLAVIEDAAQGIMAAYKDKPLGSIGALGTMSFHHTKNITSGLGGALLINDESLVASARIAWQKGTNRDAFLGGEVDKYTWVDWGSSYMMSELSAAVLVSQLEQADLITKKRMKVWQRYYDALLVLEKHGLATLPKVSQGCEHNAHMFYLVLNGDIDRSAVISEMKRRGITTPFHYVPLHSSSGGKKFGKTIDDLSITDSISNRIIRLPLYADLDISSVDYVIESIMDVIKSTQAVNI